MRRLEKEDGFTRKYRKSTEFDGRELMYHVEDYFDFPTYELLIERFNDEYPRRPESGLIMQSSGNGIKAEMRRMELDGLVMIGEQVGVSNGQGETNEGPDFENAEVKSESLILTTRGKSRWRYFWYKASDNPITTVFSCIAVIISIIALFK